MMDLKGTPLAQYMPLYQWRHEHLLTEHQRNVLWKWTSGFVQLVVNSSFRTTREEDVYFREYHTDRVLFFYAICREWWHRSPAFLCTRYKKSFYEAEAWLQMGRLGIRVSDDVTDYRGKEVTFFVRYFAWRRSEMPFTDWYWEKHGTWPSARCIKLWEVRCQRLEQMIDATPGACLVYGFRHTREDVYELSADSIL